MNRRRNQVSDCRLNYTAYGYLPVSSAEAMLGFNGQLLDGLIQGYWLGNGHRSYAPSLMRFISSDQLSPFGEGGLNSYAYCADDPINWVDPTGRAPWPGRAFRIGHLEPFSTTRNDITALPVAKVMPYPQVKVEPAQRNGPGSYKGTRPPLSERSVSRTDILVGESAPQKDLLKLPTTWVARTRSKGPTINQSGDDRFWEHRPGQRPFSRHEMIPNHQRTQGGGEIAAVENRLAELRQIQILSTGGHDPL